MSEEMKSMPFGQGNYLRLFLSVGLLVLGFFTISMETAPYGQGVWGLTVGPVLVLLGFLNGFFAIFYRSRASSKKG